MLASTHMKKRKLFAGENAEMGNTLCSKGSTKYACAGCFFGSGGLI